MTGAIVNPRLSQAHLETNQYGGFRLTDAVRPGPGVPIVPREGYRLSVYEDRKGRFQIPIITAAVSAERLFDVFLDLLEPLGDEVDVVLETSHNSRTGKHRDLRRDGMDRPILASYCCEFEDLLLNDGCTGLAVMSTRRPIEVQLDEHKQIVIYGAKLNRFRRILAFHGLERDDELQVISDGEHLHGTEPHYHDQFNELAMRMGVGDLATVW